MVTVWIENFVTGAKREASFAAVPRVGERVEVKGKWFSVQEVAHEPDADGDYFVIVRVSE